MNILKIWLNYTMGVFLNLSSSHAYAKIYQKSIVLYKKKNTEFIAQNQT